MLFQARNGLKQGGIYGERSHAVLMAALPKEDTEENGLSFTGRVEITGGSVNVRRGAGTQYGIITVVYAGQVFDRISTDENGWHAIAISGQVGWVSGKYSKPI